MSRQAKKERLASPACPVCLQRSLLTAGPEASWPLPPSALAAGPPSSGGTTSSPEGTPRPHRKFRPRRRSRSGSIGPPRKGPSSPPGQAPAGGPNGSAPPYPGAGRARTAPAPPGPDIPGPEKTAPAIFSGTPGPSSARPLGTPGSSHHLPVAERLCAVVQPPDNRGGKPSLLPAQQRPLPGRLPWDGADAPEE